LADLKFYGDGHAAVQIAEFMNKYILLL
jgi:hypothetical protein